MTPAVPPRIVTVDIMRVMAAIIVMTAHLSYIEAYKQPVLQEGLNLLEMCIPRVSPIFFLLAGYFACRNITWKKALYNAWWCLAPFVLWNGITLAIASGVEPEFPWHRSVASLFGMDGIAHSLLALRWLPESLPLNEPLWFMRDLFFLFLLSPVLFRCAKGLFPLILLLACLPWTTDYFLFNSTIGLSPNSIAFFTCGCFLRSLKPETQQRLLQCCSLCFIVLYLLWVLWQYYTIRADAAPATPPGVGFIRGLAAIVFLHQMARWLELHVPAVGRFALAFAPVTFLTFAGHLPLYKYILPQALHGTAWITLMPLVSFVLFSLLFFGLKRYAKPLLHLVAHYKQRA